MVEALRVKIRKVVATGLSLLQFAATPALAEGRAPRLRPSLALKQELALIEELHRNDSDTRIFDLMSSSMREMRAEARSTRSGPRRHEAQYLDALILAKFPTIYDLLFEDQKKKAFQSEVVGIKLSTLFDGFMEMVASGNVPPAMQEAADEVGECLAKIIVKERPNCPLEDDMEHDPSTAKLAWLRVTCGALTSNCGVRRDIFAAARPAIDKARKDPAVQEQIRQTFEKLFPERFREGMLKEIAQIRSSYGQWVASKFLPANATTIPAVRPMLVLDESDPMFVPDAEIPGQGRAHRLDGVSHGLRADLALARLGARVMEANPDSPLLHEQAAETAAAFWSSIQQLLVLTGGSRALFDGPQNGYRLIEGSLKQLPPRFSKESPYLSSELFGGWGVSESEGSQVFEPWDWEKYVALSSERGSPIRFLPHVFAMDEQGRPRSVGSQSAEQHLGDHAALLEALHDFLELTEESGAFARHLAPQSELVNLMDPTSPVLLPHEGRLLAFGVLAGVFRNLTHPDHALIEKQPKIEKGEGLGVKFFESASLESSERPKALTQSLARLVIACARIRDRVMGDAKFPGQNRKDVVFQLETLIQIGALTLIAQSQNDDGGFRSVVDGDQKVSELESSVLALRAIQTAFQISGMKILTINLKSGMRWLKTALPAVDSAEPLSAEARVSLWHFLLLWDQARPDWSTAIFGPEGQELRNQWENRLLETLN